MHATDSLTEADRLMTICNSCRYCEGLCAVFPALERRRSFADGDLDFLAHLCHACGACFYDCQFAPPHDFAVNVPQALATLREESYARYVWPRALVPLFQRNGLAVACATTISVAVFILGFAAIDGRESLFSAKEPADFYRLMTHDVMALLFGAAFLYALIAIGLGVKAFLRGIGNASGAPPTTLWRALRDAGRLRYLDGGGAGCMNREDEKTDRRRLFHHFTFYGFLLCFAATSVATLYHYLLGRIAPYPWWDLPVVLGTLGGLGLVVGPIGLLQAKAARDPMLKAEADNGIDRAFTLSLLVVGVTGLALLLARTTPAMGILLALHLGAVLAFFLLMPYGKFMHGIYRIAALVFYARERDNATSR
jgi:citrate/tricarballylate utilization protein